MPALRGRGFIIVERESALPTILERLEQKLKNWQP